MSDELVEGRCTQAKVLCDVADSYEDPRSGRDRAGGRPAAEKACDQFTDEVVAAIETLDDSRAVA